MHEVYYLAHQREEVVEVTIEDPAPAFKAMRDRTDMAYALAAISTSTAINEMRAKMREWYDTAMALEPPSRSHEAKPFSSPITKDTIEGMSKALKLTAAQISFVFEALEYAVVCRRVNDGVVSAGSITTSPDNSSSSNSNNNIENSNTNTSAIRSEDSSSEIVAGLLKSFRLGVKRRLLKENKEVHHILCCTMFYYATLCCAM